MVQLLLLSAKFAVGNGKFQFPNGTIITQGLKMAGIEATLFQFPNGTIITITDLCAFCRYLRFNSLMVQLLPVGFYELTNSWRSFNSLMVQLLLRGRLSKVAAYHVSIP